MTLLNRIKRKFSHLFIHKPKNVLKKIGLAIFDVWNFLQNRNKVRISFTNLWTSTREGFKTDWFYGFVQKYFSEFYLSDFFPHVEIFQVFGNRKK